MEQGTPNEKSLSMDDAATAISYIITTAIADAGISLTDEQSAKLRDRLGKLANERKNTPSPDAQRQGTHPLDPNALRNLGTSVIEANPTPKFSQTTHRRPVGSSHFRDDTKRFFDSLANGDKTAMKAMFIGWLRQELTAIGVNLADEQADKAFSNFERAANDALENRSGHQGDRGANPVSDIIATAITDAGISLTDEQSAKLRDRLGNLAVERKITPSPDAQRQGTHPLNPKAFRNLGTSVIEANLTPKFPQPIRQRPVESSHFREDTDRLFDSLAKGDKTAMKAMFIGWLRQELTAIGVNLADEQADKVYAIFERAAKDARANGFGHQGNRITKPEDPKIPSSMEDALNKYKSGYVPRIESAIETAVPNLPSMQGRGKEPAR
jgi:hypothetical protein